MKLPSRVALFLLVVSLVACKSYTRSLTRGHQPDRAFLASLFEVGENYKVVLRDGSKFQLKVTSVAQDSLHGLFIKSINGRIRKMESRVLLSDITEVKEARFDPVKTILLVAVPVVVVGVLINNMTFGGMNFSL